MSNEIEPGIKLLTKEEAAELSSDANWIGTLGGRAYRHYVLSMKEAVAWVRRVRKNWPGEWAVYEAYHYKTGDSIGWGATAL